VERHDTATKYRVQSGLAGSNWAVKSLEQRFAPACYLPDGPKIGSDAPPCPVNAYGLSKAFGELTGRMFVDEGRLDAFVAVRIGNYNPKPADDEALRARWIGVEDIRSLFRRCVEADLKGFHVVYAVSAQKTAPCDLLAYTPSASWSPQQVLANRELDRVCGTQPSCGLLYWSSRSDRHSDGRGALPKRMSLSHRPRALTSPKVGCCRSCSESWRPWVENWWRFGRASWIESFRDADVVLHLAGDVAMTRHGTLFTLIILRLHGTSLKLQRDIEYW
jgi:hypothetical protein